MVSRRGQIFGLRASMVLAAVGLFGVSLAVEAVHFSGSSNAASWPGYQFFACGWAGPCNPKPLFGWYGNPLFFFGVIFVLLGRNPAIAIAGALSFGAGLLVALDSLRLMGSGLAPNEGGVITLHFESFAAGFYLWLASYVVGFLAGVIAAVFAFRERRAEAERSPAAGVADASVAPLT